MHAGISCSSGEADFENGISKGTDLFDSSSEEDGSLIDFSYIHSNVMEIGLDLSCCLHLPASELPQEWMNNKEALLKYMEAAHLGVKVRRHVSKYYYSIRYIVGWNTSKSYRK